MPLASIRAVTDQTSGYSGTPLPRKLGIKPEHRVLLVHAPDGFDLGALPPGVTVIRTDRLPVDEPADVTLVFCRDRATLVRWFAPLKATLPPAAALWVAWPKKAAKIPTDVGERVVHEHGLASGLVDVKVCAVDQTWSAFKFVHRLVDRPKL